MPYFDYAATAPPERDILSECAEIAEAFFANPSSKHRAGLDAKKMLEDARTRLASVMCIDKKTLFFTSGGTESNHIVMYSFLKNAAYRLTENAEEKKPEIAVSAIEHPSITEAAFSMAQLGFNIKTIRCNSGGMVTPDAVLDAVNPATALVCVMLVNNETGAIQNIYEIAAALTDAAKKSGKKKPHFHVDCVQAAGKIPIALNGSGIDSAAFSAHKLGGARGIGLLYLSHNADSINVLAKGGGQESGIRSGTENLFGALTLASVFERFHQNPKERATEAQHKMQRLIDGILHIAKAKIIPESRADMQENVMHNSYSPYILQAAFKNIPGEVMQRMLSDNDFFISTGSACSSRKQNRPVLEAMGVSKQDAFNAVRFSLGVQTTTSEIDSLLQCLRKFANSCGF